MRRVYAGLMTALLLSLINTAYAAEQYISDTKWYANEDSNNTSSWVNNTMASGETNAYTSEVMYVAKESDVSTSLPVELCRKITQINEGEVTCEFAFSLDKSIDDMTFALVNGSEKAVSLVVRNGKLFYELGDGSDVLLSELSFSSNLDEYLYHIRINLDIDNSITKSIEVNGTTVCENISFSNPISAIDGFDVRTGEESTGTFLLSYLRIYNGYEVFEGFRSKNIPDSFNIFGNASVREFNYRYTDRYSMEIDSSESDALIIRDFSPIQGKFRTEFQLLIPEYRSGVELSLCSSDENILSISANDASFTYNSENLYDYKNNIWYHFTIEIDTENNSADIYLNGKLKADDIPINPCDYIDSLKISAAQTPEKVIVDDISVYRMILCDDYVSEPQIIRSDDYLIGMQMCPLWTEGTHTGWTAIKSAPGRKPILGYYDEGNPEVNDWEIKQMTEHGVDFQLVCAYTCYSKEIENRDPIKDNVFRHGNALHNGYFNAKYSDYMKFAILWENSGYKYGTREYNDFFDNLVPFWIEFYFKDERYLKINGRPFISIYNPQRFLELFGENKADRIAGIQRFRDVCIEEGVGDPIIAISPGAVYTDALVDEYSECGIDFAAKYNFGNDGIGTQQLHLNNLKRWNSGNDMGIIPVCVQGFNSIPWNDKGGFKASPEEYRTQLEWIKNKYAPSVGSDMLIAATWNEYGEGTVIAPTESEGFGYLDAIREVFTDTEEHTDMSPSQEQKLRINSLTIQENFNANIKEKILADPSEQNVIKGWYFDTDTEGWSPCGDIAQIDVTDGIMKVKASSDKPRIVLRDINIDTSKVNYVKITMKASSTSTDGCIYHSTSFSSNFDENKKQYFSYINSEEMSEIYVPIASGASWKGLLKDLKIVLGTNISDLSDEIEIESIELLGNEINEGHITVDGYSAECSIVDNMISLKDIADIYEAELQYFTLDDKYTVRYRDNAFIVKSGQKIMSDRYKTILLDKVPEVINGEIYVSYTTAMRMFGGSIDADEVRTGKTDFINIAREVIYEYDLSDISSMSFKHAASKYYKNGSLTLEASGNDLYIKLPVTDIEADKIKRIAVGMRSNVSSNGEIYFSREGADNFTSENVIEFPVTESDILCEYVINTEQCKNFKGTISQLRIDPIETLGTVNIAYIKLLGDVVVPDIKVEKKSGSSIELSADDNIEYSIDGKMWQSKNEFCSLPMGTYTIYWRFKGESSVLGKETVILGKEVKRDALVWDGSVDTSWYGIATREFELTTPSQVAGFAELVSSGRSFSGKKIILKSDMNFNNLAFSAAGGNTKPFKGELEGSGHILSNLNLTNITDPDFGFIARNEGIIKNLGIENSMFDAQYGGCVGILTGRNSGTIKNCFVRESVITNNSDTMNRMGIVSGRAEGGIIENTYVCGASLEGNVPRYGFGGFVGTAENGVSISGCYSADVNTSVYDKTRLFAAFDDESSWSRCYFENKETSENTILNAGATPSDYIKEYAQKLGDAFTDSLGSEYNGGYPVLLWETSKWSEKAKIESSVTTSTIGDILIAKASFVNMASTEQEVCAVIALYDNSRLIGVKHTKAIAKPLQTTEISVSTQMNKKADLIKIFTLKDFSTLEPTGEAVVINN